MVRSSAPLVIAILASSCGGAPESGGVQPAELSNAVDTLVSVGEYNLHLRVRRGDQPLTVLFEAGGAADLSSWAAVPELLSDRSRTSVVWYDRAGVGGSDLGPLELTPLEEIQGVRDALGVLGVPARTLIVAHSYGAMLALLHADAFPDDVAALVLVDPMNPRFVAAVGDWLKTTVPTIKNPSTSREFVIQRMAQTMDSLSANLLISEPTLKVPMWVVSAGEAWWGLEDVDAAWVASHEALAATSPRRRRTISEGVAHDIPADDPETILSAIAEAIGRITNSPGG